MSLVNICPMTIFIFYRLVSHVTCLQMIWSMKQGTFEKIIQTLTLQIKPPVFFIYTEITLCDFLNPIIRSWWHPMSQVDYMGPGTRYDDTWDPCIHDTVIHAVICRGLGGYIAGTNKDTQISSAINTKYLNIAAREVCLKPFQFRIPWSFFKWNSKYKSIQYQYWFHSLNPKVLKYRRKI